MTFRTLLPRTVSSLLVVLAVSTASAQQPSFTIDAALSAPFPSGLTAAPAASRLAWIFDAEGTRNIWVAEPSANGTYTSRQLTRFTGDLGVEIQPPVWSGDGQTLVFVRGGEPNPRDLPLGGTPAQIWAIALSDTTPRLIGDGSSPTPSPNGNILAYTARNSIVLTPLDGSGKAQTIVRDLGRDGSLAWSPDGGRIAFVSSRGDHSLIGVYDVARKSLTWLAPSVDRDVGPIWSPNGDRIAFIRIPPGAPGPFTSARTAEPWSIWVADAATGKGHEIWRASAGAGSRFYSLEGNSAFAWGADDRIVFPWEGTGFVHLYSVPAAGGAPTLLTPGDFEVFSADLSPDRRHVVYSSNQGDSDHRHIWTVPVAGGTPASLTTGATIADLPVYTSDGRSIAFLHADARTPMRPAVMSQSGSAQDIASQTIPEEYPGAQFVVPQPVIFRSPDGMMIHGQLFLPPNESREPTRRHPALLFFHGGPYRQMLLGANPMDAYAYMYAENQYFASRGYVVLSVNYRGGTGYGLNFRAPPKFGPSGASEFNDILGAANFLKARTDVDPKRLGVWGGSYGGYMTALALARASDVFAAGVDYAGVHDWNGLLKIYAAAGAKAPSDSIAFASSPLSSIKRWRSPVLVIQADDDHNVPFDQTVQLVKALREQRVPHELIVIPNEIHDLLLHRSWLTYFHAQSDFLDKHLLR
ncbi:MAG TPA: prolyl oligopeptidase family serine peptidase [Gemmatimonadaceae bacterium]|nr:prolyl oligopeptidase family serine peptidase [Gemmatimonadaceae bacterium]